MDNAMTIKEKVQHIESVLGFIFQHDFLESASMFGSPDQEANTWYKFSCIFESVMNATDIEDEYTVALVFIIQNMEANYIAATLLGEQIDIDAPLYICYQDGRDNDDIPLDFLKTYQLVIWTAFLEIYPENI